MPKTPFCHGVAFDATGVHSGPGTTVAECSEPPRVMLYMAFPGTTIRREGGAPVFATAEGLRGGGGPGLPPGVRPRREVQAGQVPTREAGERPRHEGGGDGGGMEEEEEKVRRGWRGKGGGWRKKRGDGGEGRKRERGEWAAAAKTTSQNTKKKKMEGDIVVTHI